MTGNEVKMSIVIDPASGKAFVSDVRKYTGEFEKQAGKAGGSMRKSFDQMFTTGLITRLAVGAYALKRLADAADQPTRKAQQLKREFGDLSKELGNTAAAAMGTLGSGLLPVLDGLSKARGEVHGLVFGLGALMTVGRPVVQMLKFAGLPGGPALAAVAVALSAIGVAIGYAGQQARDKETAVSEYLKQYDAMPIEEVNKALQRNLDLIEKLENKRRVKIDRGYIEGSEFGGRGSIPRSMILSDNEEEALRIAKLENEAIAERNRKEALYNSIIGDPYRTKTVQEELLLISLAISQGKTRLKDGRDQVKLLEAQARANLNLLTNSVAMDSEDRAALLTAEERAKYTNADTTDAERKAIILVVQKRLESDLVTLQSARVDLTEQIGQQSEKDRTEAYNRTILEAQLIDLMNLAGPVMELKAVQAERIKLETEGEGKAQTRILELRIKELELEGQIKEVLDQQLKAKLEAAAISQKAYDEAVRQALAFSGQLEAGIQSATGTTPSRPNQIRILQQELGITNLTTRALREKAEAIELGQVLGVQSLEQAEVERTKLIELTRLLSEERQAAMAGLLELQGILMGGVRSAADGVGQAFVDMFKQGEDAGKNFGKFVEQLIQRLAAQLIGSALFSIISNLLFPGSGLVLGGVFGGGGRPGDAGFGVSGIASTGFNPASFPFPASPATSAASNQRWADKIIASNDRVVAAVEGLQKTGIPLEAKIGDDHIRISNERGSYRAKAQSLGGANG